MCKTTPQSWSSGRCIRLWQVYSTLQCDFIQRGTIFAFTCASRSKFESQDCQEIILCVYSCKVWPFKCVEDSHWAIQMRVYVTKLSIIYTALCFIDTIVASLLILPSRSLSLKKIKFRLSFSHKVSVNIRQANESEVCNWLARLTIKYLQTSTCIHLLEFKTWDWNRNKEPYGVY